MTQRRYTIEELMQGMDLEASEELQDFFKAQEDAFSPSTPTQAVPRKPNDQSN